MGKSRKARQGDCVVSLALKEGLCPEAVWQHPDNEHLRCGEHARPEIIASGQIVHLREADRIEYNCEVDAVHSFRCKDVPVRLRVCLMLEGEPREEVEYLFEVSGDIRVGRTDANGIMDEIIPFDATEAVVRLMGEAEGEVYVFKIGHLDPITELTGVQARLHNLGYRPGPIDGIMGPRTERAIKIFQRDCDLEINGCPDDATRDALVERHGC